MYLRNTYLKVFLLSLLSICDCYRTFYFPPMCNFSHKTTDCSFQFPSAPAGNCQVSNTDACKNYNFSSWNLAPSSRLVSEADSEFNVSIVPYTVYYHEIQRDTKQFLSAINITLTSNSKDINGFSIAMTEDILKRNVCRIFDFRENAANIEVPLVFFYDCFRQLVEKHLENVSIAFKAYPLNTELNYFVYIPHFLFANTTSVCDWKPLVMVFRGSLSKRNVHFKFSNAPERFNVTFFDLVLVDSRGAQVRQSRLHNTRSPMISGEFLAVPSGYYSVQIAVLSAEKSCLVSETSDFFVGEKAKDYSSALLTVLFISLVISASLLIYFSGKWYIRKASPKSEPTLLFAYFHKIRLHDFLVQFTKDLEKDFGVKANLIYETSGDPLPYLREKFAQSDVIVFVLPHNLDTREREGVGKGDHHWVNQLSDTIAFVEDADPGSKKVCNVYFPQSKAEHGLECTEHKEPLFMLPKELDEFLCFVFKCPHTLYVLSKLLKEDHHKVSRLVNAEKGKGMKRKLKALANAEKSGESLLPEDKSMLESDSFMEPERVERIISDASNKMDKHPVTDNLLKECVQGSQAQKQREDNRIDLKKDPVRYCFHQILNSRNESEKTCDC